MPQEETQPETLSIGVHETVKSTELPPGNPGPSKRDKAEALPKEEIESRQKVMLEYTRLMGRYVEPHDKKSRLVTEKDLDKVIADGKDLTAMCNLPRGRYSGIAALAHPQIDNKDPLRFFVLSNGMVVINPVIDKHTKVPVYKSEACMSFYEKDIKTMVPRFNKIVVTYKTLEKGKDGEIIISDPVTEELTGGQAHVFQHKMDHFDCVYIYSKEEEVEEAKIIEK